MRRRRTAELLLILSAIFTLAWIPPALVLILRDAELRPVAGVLLKLAPWALVPFSAAILCWFWRLYIDRKLGKLRG
jgi:hypothetical protein